MELIKSTLNVSHRPLNERSKRAYSGTRADHEGFRTFQRTEWNGAS
jgi:hypothetical protein